MSLKFRPYPSMLTRHSAIPAILNLDLTHSVKIRDVFLIKINRP